MSITKYIEVMKLPFSDQLEQEVSSVLAAHRVLMVLRLPRTHKKNDNNEQSH